MDDKEYTYDIGKYTIGVDTNGEDEIGMTVAIIKNGEINFLGNCYGENARCIDLLIKENQKLKKQLEEYRKTNEHLLDKKQFLKQENQLLKKRFENCYCNRTDCSGRIKDSKVYDSFVQKVETQQKEFIKHLTDEINKIKGQIKNYDIWHEVGTDINFLILKKQFYIEILQKYKEITGTTNE